MQLRSVSRYIIFSFVFVFAFGFLVGPAMASEHINGDGCGGQCDGKYKKGQYDMVKNWNEAQVENHIEVKANTGNNYADGSYGGHGGDGGDIRNGGHNNISADSVDAKCENGDDNGGDVEDSATGNGGNGGAASTGGTVMTGNATANARVANTVNVNRTLINRCECVEEDCACDEGNSKVFNHNQAQIGNGAEVKAKTGDNATDGSYGGSAGEAGQIENHDSGDVEESMTGNGGSGGNGGEGGLVQTGHSESRLDIMNVVNRNITRVLR